MKTIKELKERRKKMQKLRNSRYKLREIGEIFGITRQRVSQILSPNYSFKIKEKSATTIYLESVNMNKGRDISRELVRLRDKHTCQDCGLIKKTTDVVKTNKLLKTLKGKIKSLDVHHINGKCGKNSTGYDSTKDLTEMITLCHKCHFNRPEHRVHTIDFSKNISAGCRRRSLTKQ